MSRMPDIDQLQNLSISDLIELQKDGLVLDTDNTAFEEEEDRDFLKNIPTKNDEIINALNIEDEDSEAPLKYGLFAPNFETLRGRMSDVLGNGKLMKLVRRKGVGGPIPRDCQVSIKYLGFFEFQDEPFDSSFAHDHSLETVRLNQGNLIPGLEFGIATMEKHETSMFLIKPELAYGELGCMPRIPPNSEVLFVVSVVEFVDNALAECYEELNQDQKRTFQVVVPRVKDALNSAKDCFSKKKYKQAIREYAKAVRWLESMKLAGDEEEKEMNRLLAKAYTNLAVCYNLDGKPRAACTSCNNNPVPSTKSIFQHGRALARIGEFKDAMKKLQQALKMEPKNREVIAEIAMVNDQLQKYKSLSKQLWSNCLRFTKEDKMKTEFEKAAEEMCKTFVKDIDLLRQPLPEGLHPDEEKCLRTAAAAHGLSVTTHVRFGKEEVFLNKINY